MTEKSGTRLWTSQWALCSFTRVISLKAWLIHNVPENYALALKILKYNSCSTLQLQMGLLLPMYIYNLTVHMRICNEAGLSLHSYSRSLTVDLVSPEPQPPARRWGLHHPWSCILSGITCPGCPIYDTVLKWKSWLTAPKLTAQTLGLYVIIMWYRYMILLSPTCKTVAWLLLVD